MTEDSSRIVLNPDQKAVALKEIKESIQGLGFVFEQLNADRLDLELGQNVLSLAEYHLAKITEVTGIPTESKVRVEERSRLLREANARVRELEKQLGSAVGPENIQLGIKSLAERFKGWWRKEGFGHTSELNFTDYGHCEAKLSCMLFGRFALTGSDTPVSDKERRALWHADLVNRGFELTESDGEVEVVDCDATRKTLLALLTERLPSALVVETNNHTNRKGGFVLRDVVILVRNLADIERLPSGNTDDD